MNVLEKDLEEIIFNSKHEELSKRGFYFGGNVIKRQLKIGKYGIADLVTFRKAEGQKFITVYELKKEKLSISSFFQAVKYIKGIQRYLEFRGKDPYLYNYSITLVGKKPNNDLIYLPDLCRDWSFEVSIYEYFFDIHGLHFKDLYGYKLVDEGFKS